MPKRVSQTSIHPGSCSGPRDLGFEDVAPLLEMASTMTLQAEVAAGLYRLAVGGSNSALPLLEVPEMTGAALVQLLSSDHLDVAYPAVCTLMTLAAYKEAEPLLVSSALFPALEHQCVAKTAKTKAEQVCCSNVLRQAVAMAMTSAQLQ